METIKEQQKIAIEILQATKKFFGNAIIAGGAPRDWHVNKLAHDLDVYLWEDKTGSLDKLVLHLGCNPDELVERIPTNRENEEGERQYPHNEIVEVWDLEYKDQSIQWIFLNTNLDYSALEELIIDMYDFEICKCFFYEDNGKGKIVLTPQARKDFKNKTLTVDIEKTYTRINRLPQRAAKLQEYFPDHKIVLKGFEDVNKSKK